MKKNYYFRIAGVFSCAAAFGSMFMLSVFAEGRESVAWSFSAVGWMAVTLLLQNEDLRINPPPEDR